jgi:hypothetical protein
MHSGGVALVWGPPRSGTTWMYNVVRDMLRLADVEHSGWVHGQQPPTQTDFKALVVKSHQAHSVDVIESLDSTDHVYLIGMFRDPGSAFQSLLRTQTADRAELLSWLVRDIDSIEDALSRIPEAVVCREEWIERHSSTILPKLSSWLGLPLDADECGNVGARFSREVVRSSVTALARQNGWSYDFRHYDPDSHWHANHIAPDDHEPAVLLDDEVRQLSVLRSRVEDLTSKYSLMARPPVRRPATDAPPVSQVLLSAWAAGQQPSTFRKRAMVRLRSLAG